uniref:Uncharacterized protein n=1 Tax=Opuntia streptacantha TaxID=393608 RepID=A0A7C9D3C8_OPUST
MESSEILEEITDDWEEIQFPSNSRASSSSSRTEHINRNTGIKEQEDLPFHPEGDSESPKNADSPPLSPLSSQDSETGLPHQRQIKSDSKLSVVIGEAKTVICATWKRMVTALGSSFR